MLTKEQILAADDLIFEVVDVPEWGGDVRIKSMTGTERDEFEKSLITGPEKVNLGNIRARLCALCIVDDGGAPVFEQEDVVALGGKSAKALDRAFEVAQKLNGLSKKDVDELEKNSGKGLSDDSISS